MGRKRELTAEQLAEAFENVAQLLDKRSLTQAGLAALVGTDQKSVSRWLKRQGGVSRENAIRLAHLTGRSFIDVQPLHTPPDAPVSPDGLHVKDQGIHLAIRLLKAREKGLLLFPKLALAIEFNEEADPSERHPWSDATIVAAAAGALGDEDLSTTNWVRALDHLERALRGVRAEVSSPLGGVKKSKA